MHATLPLLARTDFPALRRRKLDTVQVNVGYVCNQSCLHCHVNAGPTRTESMGAETARQAARRSSIRTFVSWSTRRVRAARA